jgi:hypothetical protein
LSTSPPRCRIPSSPGPRATVTDGIIFDIQRYSIHDGPGIRTVVFSRAVRSAARGAAIRGQQAPPPSGSFPPAATGAGGAGGVPAAAATGISRAPVPWTGRPAPSAVCAWRPAYEALKCRGAR